MHKQWLALLLFALTVPSAVTGKEPRQISGIYPHLAMYNYEGECGTGAVVPWAGKLWVITYGPHLPFGSSDKLYEIDADLKQTIRPESVGGTPANRMIHPETKQLLIGPYVIDEHGSVRVIPPKKMPGRLTGNARHLTDPAGKVYYATMEEGLYEVDLKTLDVVGLIKDGNGAKPGQTEEARPATLDSQLPGYHGKGLYSSQGRVVYANNGDRDPRVVKDPTVPSGALGQWFGKAGEDWQLVRRNQFTEVTGPGGIEGSTSPETAPIWSIGWDAKSLILIVLDEGKWTSYRLPKGSHSYDGAHGWNTEWPRIRDVGEDDLLMTMHGTFWKFPRDFTPKKSLGITPRSNYLKVIGDFARWNDRIVFGCDDTAKSEFLNKRPAKGDIAGPGRSHSNLWFVEPKQLDDLGPAVGRGAVWVREDLKEGEVSEPFLIGGYQTEKWYLLNESDEDVEVAVESDFNGDASWGPFIGTDKDQPGSHKVPRRGHAVLEASSTGSGWLRIRTLTPAAKFSAIFLGRAEDRRGNGADNRFEGVARGDGQDVNGGVIHARGEEFKILRFIARSPGGDIGCYDLNEKLELKRAEDPQGAAWTAKAVAIPKGVIEYDAASAIYREGDKRWRLPRSIPELDGVGPLGDARVCREVCTERDLLNVHGTFYELPAENAGGITKARAIATHASRLHDYASYRGMLVMSGLRNDAEGEHIVRSNDGKCALWVGAVDDLWKFGKPRGYGGPWKNTAVKKDVPSDPYLMNGFDRVKVSLSNEGDVPVVISLQYDITGSGLWVTRGGGTVRPGETLEMPAAENMAYWVRAVADRDTTATVQFVYE